MTTLTIGHAVGRPRLRGLALVVAAGLLTWCGYVLAVAWSSPSEAGSSPTVVVTPEPRPAGY